MRRGASVVAGRAVLPAAGVAATGRAVRCPGNGITGAPGPPLPSVPTPLVQPAHAASLHLAIETGRDHRHADLALHGRLVHRTEDDLGVVAHGVVHDLVDLVHLAQREVAARR